MMRWSCALVLLAVGCGPTISPPELEGSASGGSASGGSDTTDGIDPPAPLSCVPAPSRGADPITDTTACEAYFTDPPTEPAAERSEITIRIVNATDAPIVVRNRLVGAYTPAREPAWRYFDVTGTLGGREVSTHFEACPGLWEDPPACVSLGPEPPLCTLQGRPPSPSLRLEPGGWFEQPWAAWVTAGARLPAACIEGGADPQQCLVPVAAEPGTYEVAAEALPVDACPTGCDCFADEHGACEVVEGEERPRSTLAARVVWDGACEAVELTFAR